ADRREHLLVVRLVVLGVAIAGSEPLRLVRADHDHHEVGLAMRQRGAEHVPVVVLEALHVHADDAHVVDDDPRGVRAVDTEHAYQPLELRSTSSCWQNRCGGTTNTKPGPPSPSVAWSRLRSRPGIASVAMTESPYQDTRIGRPSLAFLLSPTAL